MLTLAKIIDISLANIVDILAKIKYVKSRRFQGLSLRYLFQTLFTL